MSSRDDNLTFLHHLLGRIAHSVHSDDLMERLWAARAIARIRYSGEADLIDCAAQEIAALGPSCLEAIVSDLEDQEECHRLLAAWTISKLGTQASSFVDAIAAHIDDHPREALLALVGTGDTAERHVLAALRHERLDIRLAAISALDTPAGLWPVPVTMSLIKELITLLNDPTPGIADAVADALDSLAAGHDHVLDMLEEFSLGNEGEARNRVDRVLRWYRPSKE